MKIFQNQKGYTLLLTLIIILVIIIFFSTFTLSAMNQQKQVGQTDDSYEATAIAEMGVEYYQATIVNLIAKHSEIAKERIEAIDELDDKKIKDIKDNQIDTLIGEINSFLNNSKNIKIPLTNLSETLYFMISYPKNNQNPVIINDNSWEIFVTGYNARKSKTISAAFELPENFDIVTTNLTSGDGTPNGSNTGTGDENTLPSFPPFNIGNITFSDLVPSLDFPITNYKEKNPIIEACPESNNDVGNSEQYYCFKNNLNSLEKIKNLNLYYTGNSNINSINSNFKNLNNFYADNSINITTNTNAKSNTSYFINGDFMMSEPIDKANNSIIQSKGNITLNKAINNMESMKIYSDKKIKILDAFHANYFTVQAESAQLSTLNSLKNSMIEIENNAKFGPIGNPMSNSYIQINNTDNVANLKTDENLATFDYFNYITNNSLIKINGNAYLGKYIDKMDKNSEILINGNAKVGYLKNINDQSFIRVNGNADFGSYIDVMDGGNILVNGNIEVGYLQNIKNKSNIHVNGNADFGSYIQTMEGGNILINGELKVGYINNLKNGSKIYVKKDADFGARIESIEGGSSVNVMGNATVGKLVMQDGDMEVKGTLNIIGQKAAVIRNGIVLVNKINVIDPDKQPKDNLSVEGGKLCIRDFSNTYVMSDIKATSHGKIIFLNSTLPKDQIRQLKVDGSTGSHVLEAGTAQFINECGTGIDYGPNKPSNSNTYDIEGGTILTVEDITSTIEYQ